MKTNRKLTRGKKVELKFLEGIRNRCPRDPHILRALGELYTSVGCFEEGLQTDLELIKILPEESEAWYNLGCSYALTGEKDSAFHALERAVELGYKDARWMTEDDDLVALRDDPRFPRLISKARS